MDKRDTGPMCEQAHNPPPLLHARGTHRRQQTPFCSIKLPYTQFSHYIQDKVYTHRAICSQEARSRKGTPLLLFHILPCIQHWHLLRCISSLCLLVTLQTSTLRAKPALRCTNYSFLQQSFLCITYVLIFSLLYNGINRKKGFNSFFPIPNKAKKPKKSFKRHKGPSVYCRNKREDSASHVP